MLRLFRKARSTSSIPPVAGHRWRARGHEVMLALWNMKAWAVARVGIAEYLS